MSRVRCVFFIKHIELGASWISPNPYIEISCSFCRLYDHAVYNLGSFAYDMDTKQLCLFCCYSLATAHLLLLPGRAYIATMTPSNYLPDILPLYTIEIAVLQLACVQPMSFLWAMQRRP